MGAVQQPANGFGDDPDRRPEHERDLDKGRQAFDLAMAVVVIFIGWPVGDPDRDQREHGGNQVDRRVRGFGQHAERPGDEASQQLERGNNRGGQNGEQRSRPLGGLGALRCRCRRAHGSDGTAAGCGLHIPGSSLLSTGTGKWR